MSVYRDKARGRWVFEFSRRIGGVRVRARKLLPPAWTRAQADAFDRAETARLYALASGVEQPVRLIDDAVLAYLQERGPHLRNLKNLEGQFAACFGAYSGRPITDLPAVAREYSAAQAGILSPGTIRNRIRYLTAACPGGQFLTHLLRPGPLQRQGVVGVPLSSARQRLKLSCTLVE